MKFGLQNKDILAKLDFKAPSVWVATWGGCGLIQPAPGTWGTLGAVPFGVFLILAGGLPALLAGIVLVTAIGFWASEKFEKMSGEKDSSMIVIDEVAGFWIALIPASLSPLSVLIAFILFRLFDILKPWPASWFDGKLEGPISVMGDDIVAGFYAALGMVILNYAGLPF